MDLLISVLDSPYANYLIRQFILTALTKISGRPTTSQTQQQRIASLLDTYTNSPELEIQQRAVEFESLLHLGDVRIGVLERMPPPELKATVMGIGMYQSLFSNCTFEVIDIMSKQLWRINQSVLQHQRRLVHGHCYNYDLLNYLTRPIYLVKRLRLP